MKNKILLIAGKSGSGKSTLAYNLLSNAFLKDKYFIKAYAFADKPKELIQELFNISCKNKSHYIEHLRIVNPLTGNVMVTVRELLKMFCEEIHCKMNPYVWANVILNEIRCFERKTLLDVEVKNQDGYLHIISDLRKLTELERVNLEFEETHNIKTIRLMKQTNSNSHISEVGLDFYDKFDCYMNNTTLTPELCYLKVIEQLRNWQWV